MTLSEKEMAEKILQHFSDILTTTQAIRKLKSLRLGQNELILAYNMTYKVLAERVEGKPIQEVQSAVAMEMYLGNIIAPLRRNIKENLFWNSKHAPKNLGEAMKKSEELYVKHLYSLVADQEDDYVNKRQQEVVINEVNYGERRDFRRLRYDDKHEKLNYHLNYGKWRDGVPTTNREIWSPVILAINCFLWKTTSKNDTLHLQKRLNLTGRTINQIITQPHRHKTIVILHS